jgi:hypothetical protein
MDLIQETEILNIIREKQNNKCRLYIIKENEIIKYIYKILSSYENIVTESIWGNGYVFGFRFLDKDGYIRYCEFVCQTGRITYNLYDVYLIDNKVIVKNDTKTMISNINKSKIINGSLKKAIKKLINSHGF